MSPERVFGAFDSSATAQLVQERLRRSTLELLAVLKVLQGRGLTRLEEAERLLRDLPSSQFVQVWSAPDAYFWTRLAYGFARDGLNDKFAAKFARWDGLTEENFEQGLAERLILIALSGQAMAGETVHLLEPVALPRTGSMASTPIAWSLAENLKVFGTAGERLLAGTSSASFRPLDATNFDGVLRMPEVRGVGVNVDVWSECVRVDVQGLEQNERVSDFSVLQQQAEVFASALALIRASAAATYDEISLVLRSATPLVGDGRSLPSSSNSSITGVMWYTECDVPELLAEMIIHEFSHSKIFLLQDLDPLLDESLHGTGWDACEFYSPWRDDPRPLNGILHGYLVFSEAALFWARHLQNSRPFERELGSRRFGMLVRQIELARKVLERHCHFTGIGRAVMEYFSNRLDSTLLPLTVQWKTDELPVLHLERHTEFDLHAGVTIAASIAAHQGRWESNYGAAVAS